MLLGGALVASEINRRANSQAVSEIADELAQTRETANAALAAVIAPTTINDAAQSVYQVQGSSEGYVWGSGTAFVIDRERGILATNAHVAESFNSDDTELFVAAPHSANRLPVRAIRMHKGRERFLKIVEGYSPVRNSSPISDPEFVDIYHAPFDVALLFVDPVHPETGEPVLAPALAIADDEILQSLKAGDAVASIGFPSDRVHSATDQEDPSHRIVRGVIGDPFPPIPLGDSERASLGILFPHRMRLVGGTSGSPIINSAGVVVGLQSFKSGNEGGDGGAQRADVLLDLLEPQREELRNASVYEPAWVEALTQFAPGESALAHHYYLDYTKQFFGNGDATVFDALSKNSAFKFESMNLAFNTERDTETPFILPANDLCSEYVMAENREPESDGLVDAQLRAVAANDNICGLTVPDEKNTPSIDAVPVFRINGAGEYRHFEYEIDLRRRNVLVFFDYSMFGKRTLCPLSLYIRQKGATQIGAFGAQHGSIHRNIIFWTDPEAQRPGKFDIIVRRNEIAGDKCDKVSKTFSVLHLAWEEPAADITAVAAHRGEAPRAPYAAAPETLLTRVSRAAQCPDKFNMNFRRCLAPAQIEWRGETMSHADVASIMAAPRD